MVLQRRGSATRSASWSLSILLSLLALVAASAPAALGATKGEKALRKALQAGNADKVVTALDKLGDDNSERAVKLILKVALSADGLSSRFGPKDTNRIFDGAKSAIAVTTDKRALKFVYKTVRKHRDPRVRLILVEVCGVKEDAEAEAALVLALRDKSSLVSGTACRILGARSKLLDAGAVVGGLIDLFATLEKSRRAPWQDALQALVRLSGEEIDTAADWRGWWKVKAEGFQPSGKTSASAIGGTVRRNAPKLFGKEILSKKVVFILDVSGSMALKDPKDEAGNKGRWVDPKNANYPKIPVERMRMFRLKKAMSKALGELPPDTYFTLITFSSTIAKWKPKLVPATSKNKADAKKFTAGMAPQGFTWTDVALERAFDVKDANAFYLFSDGIPQKEKGKYIDRAEILEKVKQLNRLRKVRIYTIGFGEADAGFMTALATQNGGDFTAVD